MSVPTIPEAEVIARRVLEEWKTYAWGTGLAPSIDVAGESHAVAERWGEIGSPGDAARVVAEVFAAAHPERRDQFNPYTCTSVGTRLYRELCAAGLMPPRTH